MVYVDRKANPALTNFENARDCVVARLQSLNAIAISAGVGANVTEPEAWICEVDREFIGVQAMIERLDLDENSGLNNLLAKAVRQLESRPSARRHRFRR